MAVTLGNILDPPPPSDSSPVSEHGVETWIKINFIKIAFRSVEFALNIVHFSQ